jgi:hypothetical protein
MKLEGKHHPLCSTTNRINQGKAPERFHPMPMQKHPALLCMQELTLGVPNLFILIDLLQYIYKCAQMHKSTISKKINLLYVAVDPSLYTHYSASKAYPQDMYPFPDNVDEVPNFTACTNNSKRATAKILHTINLKTHNVINMNAVLIDTLLSLISSAFKLLYEHERMLNPNYYWFVINYGRTLAKIVRPNGWQLPPTGTLS